MTDFTHLQRLSVNTDKTYEKVLYQIEGEPVLILAPATDANKPYLNELLRRSRKNMQRIKNQAVNASILEESRAEDRELYSRYILKGWRGVKDASGKDVPFSKEAAKEFLDAIPNYIFDEIRDEASNPQNFIDDVMNTEDIAKN